MSIMLTSPSLGASQFSPTKWSICSTMPKIPTRTYGSMKAMQTLQSTSASEPTRRSCRTSTNGQPPQNSRFDGGIRGLQITERASSSPCTSQIILVAAQQSDNLYKIQPQVDSALKTSPYRQSAAKVVCSAEPWVRSLPISRLLQCLIQIKASMAFPIWI